MLFSSLFFEWGKNTVYTVFRLCHQQQLFYFVVMLCVKNNYKSFLLVCQVQSTLAGNYDPPMIFFFLNLLFHGCTHAFSKINLSIMLRICTNHSEGNPACIECCQKHRQLDLLTNVCTYICQKILCDTTLLFATRGVEQGNCKTNFLKT